MRVIDAIAGRHSVRHFDKRDVPPDAVRELIAAACAAPAPHHSRPWRFVDVLPATRPLLTDAMAEAWRAGATERPDLDRAIARSRRELTEAPVLLLACLELENAHGWPDERRRQAERDMYMQSLGAALQNLLLAAHTLGLGGYIKGAPLFCRHAVSLALELPPAWEPAFLVLLGYPAEGVKPPERARINPDDFLTSR